MTAKKESPIHQRDRIKRQPCRRLEVLALLTAAPMTRHAIGEKLGIGYDCAAMHVAALQANWLATPCGHEQTPGKRTYRMLFKAVAK